MFQRNKETILRCVAGLLLRLFVTFSCNGLPITTTISPRPALRFPHSPSRMSLLARLPGVLAYVRHHLHRSRPIAYPLLACHDPASAPCRHETFQRWSLRGAPEGPGRRDSVSRSDRGHPCVVHPPSRLLDQEEEQSLRDFGGHTDCVPRGHSGTNALPHVLVSTVADSSRSGHNEEVLRASLRGTWGVCAGSGRQKEGPRGVQRAAMETRRFTKLIDQTGVREEEG